MSMKNSLDPEEHARAHNILKANIVIPACI